MGMWSAVAGGIIGGVVNTIATQNAINQKQNALQKSRDIQAEAIGEYTGQKAAEKVADSSLAGQRESTLLSGGSNVLKGNTAQAQTQNSAATDGMDGFNRGQTAAQQMNSAGMERAGIASSTEQKQGDIGYNATLAATQAGMNAANEGAKLYNQLAPSMTSDEEAKEPSEDDEKCLFEAIEKFRQLKKSLERVQRNDSGTSA